MAETEGKYKFEIRDGEIGEEDIKIEYVGSQAFPKIPLKLAIYSFGLLITGVCLLIVGVVYEFTHFEEPSRGIAFWVLGSLTLVPGVYFTYLFYRAFRAKTPAERLTILRQIPESN